MKPSMRKLWEMLPRVLVVRHDVLNGNVVGTDCLDGVTGKPVGLDFGYPGFQSNLMALVKANLVVHAGDVYNGKMREDGMPIKGQAEQVFISMRPTEKVGAS